MPFKPGQSGNLAGRQRGSRNKRTVIVEKLWDDNAGEVTTAAIAQAKSGDPAALRACLDRVAPRRQPIDFDMPQLVTLADVPVAFNALVQGLAHGELDLEVATVLMRGVRDFAQAVAPAERNKFAAGVAGDADDGDASTAQSLEAFVEARP
jgi:hypothetical protein